MIHNKFRRGVVATAISIALANPLIAIAAEEVAEQQAAADKKVEKIVITGSRIKRDSFSSATPLVVLDRSEVVDYGTLDLQEILVDGIPSISESSSNTNSQSSVQNTGLSTINLRNLGSNRTLTLIDGRRTVSNSYSGNMVSLSTIPAGMVERVEVISGGASAIYGSDAVAGVVNIITQKDKEGFEIRVNGGQTPEGGGEEHSLDFNFGTSFNEGRGYTYFSANYNRDFGVHFNDRDQAQITARRSYNDETMCNEYQLQGADSRRAVYGCKRDHTQAEWGNSSDGTPGGVFEESTSSSAIQDGGWYYDENGLQTGWREEIHGVNFHQWDWLSSPIERTSVAFKIDYELTDDLKANFQLQYANNQSANSKSPEDEYEGACVLRFDPVTGDPSDICAGSMANDHPFMPAEMVGNVGSSISWDRRMYEVGQVTTDNDRTTIRAFAGLQGSMLDGTWDWDLSLSHGTFQQDQLRLNEINVQHEAWALDAEYVSGNSGPVQCASAEARTLGCVPLNIFGINSITPEMANWIRANPTIDNHLTQTNLLGYISGELFEMPAGTVAAVFGFEYRKDTQDLVTSDDLRFGGVTFNQVPQFSGDISVKEAFAEFAIPLAKDLPGMKNVNLDLSIRVADYSPAGIDLVQSYRAGLLWVFNDMISARTNFARAQRAPTITELISPPRGDYDNFDDICDGLTATSTAAGHDACRQDPTLIPVVAALASGETFNDENTGYSPNAGNENLFEETSDTFTFGITLEPFENFNIAVDYYDIQIDDAIEQIDNNDIINNCYNSSIGFGGENVFCQNITRNSEGQIKQIIQQEFNLNSVNTRGVDVAISYKYDMADYGSLRLSLNNTHVSEWSKTFTDNDGTQTNHYAGYRAENIFTNTANASLRWSMDNLRVRWRTSMKSDAIDSIGYEEEYLTAIAANDELCAAADAACIANPEVAEGLYIPSYVKHSVSVSYDMKLSNDSNLRLFGGVNNIFDNIGIFAPNEVGNSWSAYGRTGRYVYLGAEYQF